MRYLIPIFLCVVACAEELPRGKTEVARFEATVTAVEHFKQFSGRVKILTGDPKFVFTLKKEDGVVENFGIHSVVLFFIDDAKTVVRKKFKFVETRVYNPEGKLLRLDLAVDRDQNAEK